MKSHIYQKNIEENSTCLEIDFQSPKFECFLGMEILNDGCLNDLFYCLADEQYLNKKDQLSHLK